VRSLGGLSGGYPVLDKTDLFGALPPELLEQLRDRATVVKYRRGDLLFAKGDEANRLFVVMSGRVAITAASSEDRSERCPSSTAGAAPPRLARSRVSR
jgi:hypothetical protein